MVKLNGSAGEVLNLVNGESTVESITDSLSKKFTDAPNISKDIVGMIELALDKAWIEKVG
jgi:pyrroloquinoline quinone biosynthesis protein D